MPLFRYACAECEAHFELYVGQSDVPRCPDCDSGRLSKQFTRFSVGKGGATAAPQVGACGQVCGRPGGCESMPRA
jgi:putative FmdB family regulatory protein